MLKPSTLERSCLLRLFLLPATFNGESSVVLTGRDRSYLVDVLRLREGASLTGRDKNGGVWNLTITSITKKILILSAVKDNYARETTDALPESRPRASLVLYQCLPKGRKMDEIVKRATEIGAAAIVPVRSHNCVATGAEEREEAKSARYNALIKEAVQQSGSLVPTALSPTLDVRDVPGDFELRAASFSQGGSAAPSIGLLLHQCRLEERQKSLFEVLDEFLSSEVFREESSPAPLIALLVGPEGGFTDGECAMMLESGFKPVLLKTNILRCETAAVYALAAVQAIAER